MPLLGVGYIDGMNLKKGGRRDGEASCSMRRREKELTSHLRISRSRNHGCRGMVR